jgi:cold shock CspA family protein
MPTGTVTEFDAAKGLGTVVDDEGVAFLFHVVEIADGTRAIDVGQAVHFEPLPRFGRYQAATLRKV